MAKNPAVLWYPADYLVGVIGMTWEEQGRYTYLLNLQHQRGHLDIKTIMPDCPQSVLKKFTQDDDGLYYNIRMEEEQIRREKYSKSRSENRRQKTYENHMNDISQSYEKHMENENENININNKFNTKTNPPTPLTAGRSDEAGDTVRQVVDYLNTRAGTNYRASSKATIAKVRARLNEGFTLNDFMVVIDKKAAEWTGTEYAKYLRPETLFGPKFESYLNQKTKGKSKNKFLALLEEGRV